MSLYVYCGGIDLEETPFVRFNALDSLLNGGAAPPMLDNNPRVTSFINLLKSSSPEELVWMHGYLSATLGGAFAGSATAPAVSAPPKVSRFTLAYGTETGNSKRLATDLAKKAKESGFRSNSWLWISTGSRISRRNPIFS